MNAGSLEQARTLFTRGLAAYGAGRLDEAEQAFREALALAPGRVSILGNLAAVLLKRSRPGEARDIAEQAVRADPDNFEACLTLGASLLQTGAAEPALRWLDKACALRADSAEAWTNRGNALLSLKRPADALADLERATSLDPALADAWTNRGNALSDLGRHEEAVASHERALALQPQHAEAWYNLGNAWTDQQSTARAIAAFERAIAARPDFAGAHVNKAVVLLDSARFAEAWPEYEWRWRNPDFPSTRPATPMPAWDGQRLEGTLWIFAEQGIGDEVLYLGLLASIRPLARRLLVSADHRLLPLLRRANADAHADCEFIDRRQPVNATQADRHIAMGSLAQFCRKSLADFGAQRPWLLPDPARLAAWRERCGGGRQPVCGIAWSSKNPRVGRDKSVRLTDLLPVLRLPGVRFVDLQYGDTATERADLRAAHGLGPEHFDDLDSFNDIEGLCALIAACDLVVTTSNVTTHLAGAMGRPVLQLTPHARGKLWYWHRGIDPSPWYPSVHLYEQATDGDWSAAIAAVAGEAGRRLGSG